MTVYRIFINGVFWGSVAHDNKKNALNLFIKGCVKVEPVKKLEHHKEKWKIVKNV